MEILTRERENQTNKANVQKLEELKRTEKKAKDDFNKLEQNIRPRIQKA